MRPILKLAVSLFFLFFLTASNFKDYFIILDKYQYLKLAQRGDKEILKRSIVFDELIQPDENPHLNPNEIAKTQQFAFLLKKMKRKDIDLFLLQHDSSLVIHQFYIGFCHFMKGEYKLAEEALQQYRGNNFLYHKHLLIGDCRYELNTYNTTNELVLQYQKAMDIAKSDIEKEIVKNRVKYIIYNHD